MSPQNREKTELGVCMFFFFLLLFQTFVTVMGFSPYLLKKKKKRKKLLKTDTILFLKGRRHVKSKSWNLFFRIREAKGEWIFTLANLFNECSGFINIRNQMIHSVDDLDLNLQWMTSLGRCRVTSHVEVLLGTFTRI